MNRFVDWRRLALAAPLLVIAGVALYALVLRGDASAGTRRALLADTPPGIEDSVGVRQGQLARDFVAVSPDGTEVRLSDLRGTPVIINFWASWCTSCLAEMPEFHDLQQRIGVDNLQVVAINTGESADTAQEFVEKLGVDTFRIALDPTLVVADAYGVFGMPTSIFLDADGVVRATYAGHIPGDTLEEFVTAARSGASAPESGPRLRVVTTVAREHVLEVREVNRRTLEVRSKSLRCDNSYCASEAIDAVFAPGVSMGVNRHLDEDPPRIVIVLDPDTPRAREAIDVLLRGLAANPDPLYERPLEVIWR